jgi:hypothetical protein
MDIRDHLPADLSAIASAKEEAKSKAGRATQKLKKKAAVFKPVEQSDPFSENQRTLFCADFSETAH